MAIIKKYNNGLRLVAKRIEGLLSVTAGVLVYTGSANEDDENNGISHFIEHTVFKGTEKRSAFEISDYIDSIGAQINAFTSKEMTCFYTKSTKEHLKDSLDVLADIFFNATFDKKEINKEKGVIIEEINMCEDSPEDLCLDLLSKAYYGEETYGRTILGPKKNIRRFTVEDVKSYMSKYYTADNVVISIAGNIDEKDTEKIVGDFFADKFKNLKSKEQVKTGKCVYTNAYKSKKIEQSHIGISFDSISIADERMDALNIANVVLGGGMSSRLFQKIREEQGLCYSIYSYPSYYKDNGVMEIYAGVSLESRDEAFKSILEEIEKFKNKGITEQELTRGKEQMKSS
ncbi:MAG: insulinase family protein, partial [Firmicutes bacterium]|nr:insulinase family protein [Candidatus Caballimonas caccae]